MALRKNIKLDNGIEIENAYLKICDVLYYNKVGETSYVSMTVSVHKDEESRLNRLPEVTQLKYKITDTSFNTFFSLSALSIHGNNIINQGYKYLKTLSMYNNAIDVVDEKE